MDNSERVTFGELIYRHFVSMPVIIAMTDGMTPISMFHGYPVDKEDAEQVIAVFNKICQTSYSLKDINVVLCSDNNPCYKHKTKVNH